VNRLKGARVYQAGPIERAKDFGHGWRNDITPILSEMGIVVLNPLRKPLLSWEESEECMQLRKHWRETGQYEKINSLSRIRNTDLRMVDISDFVIAYLDMEARPAGTFEEIYLANKQKKPVIIVAEGGYSQVPDWVYWALPFEFIHENFDGAIQYLRNINSGLRDHKRFVHFDYSMLTCDGN
jgi:nucleoside 2-deoxyribosyltransferase